MSFKNNKINIILFALVCIAMLLSFSSVYAEGNNVTSDISCVEMDNSVKEVYCFSIEDSTDILSSIDNNTSDRLYTKTNNENQESILKTSDLDSLQVSSNRVVLNNNFNMDDYINQSLRSPTGPFVVSSSGHGYATLLMRLVLVVMMMLLLLLRVVLIRVLVMLGLILIRMWLLKRDLVVRLFLMLMVWIVIF